MNPPGKLMNLRFSQSEMSADRFKKIEQEYKQSHPQKKYNLSELSNPPTDEELKNLVDLPAGSLPPKYKRKISQRVFANRDLRLGAMEFFGFDMDYTLAIYNSPDFEQLSYDLTIKKLINIGYPEEISSLRYDPSFPIRGLFLDKDLGNLLKIDNYGNIVFCVHGRSRLTKRQTERYYPSMVIRNEDIGRRFYLLNTLFTIPEACLYGDLVDFFEKKAGIRISDEVAEELEVEEAPTQTRQTQHVPHADVSYANLFLDVRTMMDLLHADGSIKKEVIADTPKYIRKTPELAVFLDKLKKNKGKTFLLTNSEYYYTKHVMTYLLDGQNPNYPDWKDYFDITIVEAQKPRFFGEGTTFREVDIQTGHLKINKIEDKFEQGKVYQGGSMSLFQKMTGAKGSKVLYFGDHIFADIIKSKKIHGWRNLLIVPELHHELEILEKNKDKYNHLINLEFIKAEIFRGLDSNSSAPPDVAILRKHIKETNKEVDESYNKYFGSLFRTGSKQSFFAMQVQRYADLYTSEYMNLLNYPLFYEFSGNSAPLPHEALDDYVVAYPTHAGLHHPSPSQ